VVVNEHHSDMRINPFESEEMMENHPTTTSLTKRNGARLNS